MAKTNEELRLHNLRFNLLAKNLVSGVAVLLTPGLIFLVSLAVLWSLYSRVDAKSSLEINWVGVTLGLLVALVVGGLVSWGVIRFISRSVTSAAASVAQSAQMMARGDFTVAAHGVTNDELADLATEMNTTRAALSALLTATSRVYQEVSAKEKQLRESLGNLSASGEQISTKAAQVSQRSHELNTITKTLTEASRDISQARRDIAAYATKALEIGQTEIVKVETISSAITEFQRESVEIAEAVENIADIAERTSLLALNATIESAKAAESGAGFAVVAGKIKELAVQTSASAASVTEASTEIQSRCDHSVGVTQTVKEKLSLINSAQEESNQAVSDQAAIVSAMEQSCSQAFSESQALATEIASIAAAAEASAASLETITAKVTQLHQNVESIHAFINTLILDSADNVESVGGMGSTAGLDNTGGQASFLSREVPL